MVYISGFLCKFAIRNKQRACAARSLQHLEPMDCNHYLPKQTLQYVAFRFVAALVLLAGLLNACADKQPTDLPDFPPTGQNAAERNAEPKTDGRLLRLLETYEEQNGAGRTAIANRIFGLLYAEELTDSLVKVANDTPKDEVDAMVLYHAAEYFGDKQDYATALNYARKALPLTYKSNDLLAISDCEQLIAQLLFRQSDFVRAITHAQKSLELDRETGDKSRISSSLNTLAGISLVAKQPEEGERYILEAIALSTAANDSNRMAIQYGMASEIYHAMKKEQLALEHAVRAYQIDEQRGNVAKMGIRLSQMATALMDMERFVEAERSVDRAILILAKAGNKQSLGICMNQKGELLNRRGEYASAQQCFEKAIEIFEQRNDLYNLSRAQMGAFNALKAANPTLAAQHLQRYVALKDSIYQHDMEQAVSQSNAKYKNEELTLQAQHEQKEKRIVAIAAIVVVSLLLLVVAALVYVGRIRQHNHALLKQVSRLRENFYTNITHELRTPLTLILGLSHELSQDEALTDEAKHKAQTIERQGNSLLTLINQLLDIARVKSAVGNPDWENADITAHVNMVVESYRDCAVSQNIELGFSGNERIVTDFVPEYINKVMNNLLSNAFKFTPPYGKVSVAVAREGANVVIRVKDTGAGIAPEAVEHLFEPFYRASNGASKTGTGVGLALVRQIIDALDGQIGVGSAPGRGATFTITLPIRNVCKPTANAQKHTNTPMLPHVEKRLDDETNDNCAEQRMLIVEDNADLAAYMGSLFTPQYAVCYASNGEEALARATELVPDIIITDRMMPGMDGLEVCKQVRASDVMNHIPIVVVTGKITEQERLEGIKAGADAYITKPFNSEELTTRVENLLDRHRQLREKYGDNAVETKEGGDVRAEAERQFLTKAVDTAYLLLDKRALDVNALAEGLGMSLRQFSRKMVALTGNTPGAFILNLKMQKGKQLLDTRFELNIEEISERCGFEHASSFYHAFKKAFGVTPSEYRKNGG